MDALKPKPPALPSPVDHDGNDDGLHDSKDRDSHDGNSDDANDGDDDNANC